jgi:hypothetical protein
MSEEEVNYGNVQGNFIPTTEQKVDRLDRDLASMRMDLFNLLRQLEQDNKEFKEKVEALVDRYADRLNVLEEKMGI